ncbi:aaa family atpase [Fusarium sp. NRRL 52700]|nr:aaa family atpase [Fusarium sp. NRRL 52700]
MLRKRQRLDDLAAAGSAAFIGQSYRNTPDTDLQGARSPALSEVRSREPIRTIDWRAELCRVLEKDHGVSNEDLLNELDAAFDELKESRQTHHPQDNGMPATPRYQTLYRTRCHGYGDMDGEDYAISEASPWVVGSGPYKAHLRSSRPIPNLELYLERNNDITFIVYVDFECCGIPSAKDSQQHSDQYHQVEGDAFLLQTKESITIVSTHIKTVLEELAVSVLQDTPHLDSEIPVPNMPFPYLWWFHRRGHIEKAIAALDPDRQWCLRLLQDYITHRLQRDWEKVDNLTAEGLITLDYLEYIYIPGQILLSKTQDSRIQGYCVADWLEKNKQYPEKSSIRVSSWSFDGTFRKVERCLNINPPHHTDELEIASLPYYPEHFARPEIVQRLLDRGQMVWKCRKWKYVSTTEISGDGIQHSLDSRFMIDMGTYKQLHPHQAKGTDVPDDVVETLTSDVLEQDEPSLDGKFFKCLPATLPGFNMHKKQWVILEVSSFREVQWNSKAFDFLVVSPATKELIKAVVTNRLDSQANVDIVHGKGNGLFILLHGAPGTGKTLTAESIAEITKRPLYRVVCSDMGTKPEMVEKYLESVLHLGATWDCVVLLDEADVFLEQRSLASLERNALVSVFLRVLEYFDGILVLTSNRVGIFDEAFKSRIQLSLRYNNLGQHERHTIWNNFFLHLDRFQDTVMSSLTSKSRQVPLIGYGMDIPDLRDHLDELSQAPLNGREIRNSLSIARQLAVYKREKLQFRHLKDVMDEAKKFDDEVNMLNDGIMFQPLSI